MCDAESVQTMQRGMNFRMNPAYSVFLMSQKSNAPYSDRIYDDGVTIEYEGHDLSKNYTNDPKLEDQPQKLPSGRITQNGLFINAVNEYKKGKSKPEIVKIYEKIQEGVWSLKGYFDLTDYKTIPDGKRTVFRFILKLSDGIENFENDNLQLNHTRLIPSHIKKDVWKRDQFLYRSRQEYLIHLAFSSRNIPLPIPNPFYLFWNQTLRYFLPAF